MQEQDEFGDQRAKDLIDAAESAEAAEAILLLDQALSFGEIGIQASKAFERLGIAFESIGSRKTAIKYYTKSMEAWHPDTPNAIVLFWRGRLYLEEGMIQQAQLDLARAIISGLSVPEVELAQNYLAEITRRLK